MLMLTILNMHGHVLNLPVRGVQASSHFLLLLLSAGRLLHPSSLSSFLP